MNAAAHIRRAGPEDVATCARIVSAWAAETPWLPQSYSEPELEEMIRAAMPEREIYLIGEPAVGYLSLNPATHHIGALYVGHQGEGLGRALMDRAKQGRDRLRLNTHEPNTEAQRFYAREGFTVVGRIENGTDGLPELVMEWRR
ncbi:MAG: GNAT family N-acetyltransferase [Silicimonas sp.]|nr:GNAT family N-acetyltransferase [Silicimonas sp.]